LLRFLDHTHTQTHSVAIVLTSDQLVAEAIMYTTHSQTEAIPCVIGIQTHDTTKETDADLHLKEVS